jgi:uncharacterized membrane protein YdbT with pleckstrin-like domain
LPESFIAEKYKSFRPAWKSFSVYILAAALFWFGPAFNPDSVITPDMGKLIGSLFLAFIVIKRFTNQYFLDNGVLQVSSTFPKKSEANLAVERIRRIDLRRGITQRALGVAHIHIYEDARGEPALKLFGVANPAAFRELLLELGASDERVTGAWRK